MKQEVTTTFEHYRLNFECRGILISKELWLLHPKVEWDNVPGEFECAIMGELMQDPVILPSGNRCDRKNIERHILSTPNDPFNRCS